MKKLLALLSLFILFVTIQSDTNQQGSNDPPTLSPKQEARLALRKTRFYARKVKKLIRISRRIFRVLDQMAENIEIEEVIKAQELAEDTLEDVKAEKEKALEAIRAARQAVRNRDKDAAIEARNNAEKAF